jgi:hypothetical protein
MTTCSSHEISRDQPGERKKCLRNTRSSLAFYFYMRNDAISHSFRSFIRRGESILLPILIMEKARKTIKEFVQTDIRTAVNFGHPQQNEKD